MSPTKRMSADAFLYFCNQYSEDSFYKVTIEANKFEVFRAERKNKKKTNKRFGPKLGPIFDWLDENVSQPYYAKFDQSEKNFYNYKSDVLFYFVNQHDAVMFKLMFMEEA